MFSEVTRHTLPIALAAAVPLWIYELQARGGPGLDDWDEAREFSQVLAEKGDKLLFRSEKEGETAELFNRLAKALAVLAFAPGGVRAFGEHWEAKA